jgi:hypothetical protein
MAGDHFQSQNILWDGPRKNGTRVNRTSAAAAKGAAILTHDQDNHRGADSALAAWRTGPLNALLKIGQGLEIDRAGSKALAKT